MRRGFANPALRYPVAAMAERGEPSEEPDEDRGSDLEEVVRDEVNDARREIFSAYVRAREAGMLMGDDSVPADDAPED